MPPVEADFRISIDPRSLTQATREANGFDRALASARDAVNDLERTINRLEPQIDLEVDTSQIRNAAGMIDDLSGVETVTIHANDQDLQAAFTALSNLDEGVSTTISVNDQELDDAKGKIDKIDTSAPSVDVNVNTSDQDLLDTLADLGGTVDLVVNIATTGANLAGGAMGLLGVDELVETDAAAVRLQYTTGQVIENAEGIADALFLANWGESRAQILDYIGAATLLGVEAENMEAALTAAFQTSAITGFEMEETLRAQQSLVKNGLVPDFETAGTVIAAAFQSGTNVGDDLLDTVNEYSSTFAALGFTSDQVLSALNSGLAAGADNTDRIADAIREFGIKAREGTDEFRTAIEDLDLTDVYESFLAGETTGADFFGQLTNELGQVKDLAEQTAIATATIGTQSEDFSVDVIANIEVDQDQLQAITAATESVDLIGTDLNSQIEEFSRFAETEIHEALRSAFNIEEFIDNAKLAIDGFFTTLEGGGSIGEAVGVAIDVLNIPMLEDFQQTLSGLVIGMLQAAESLLSFAGQDTTGLQGAITDLSTEQFLVDIAVADGGASLSEAVTTALDRGVSVQDTYRTLVEQMESAFARGDFDLAVNIRDELQNAGGDTQRLLEIFQQSDGNRWEFQVTARAEGLEGTFAEIGELAEQIQAEGIPLDYFAQVGDYAGQAFSENYIAQLQAMHESGQLGQALTAAAAVGDTEAIGGLATEISTLFFTALEEDNAANITALSDDATALLAHLQEQLVITPNDEGLQAWIDSLSTALTEVEGMELPITQEDAETVAAANASMAESTEATTERTTAAVTEQSEVHAAEHSDMQNTETETADVTERAGQDVIDTYGLTEAEIRRLSQVATTEFPRVANAFNNMATQVDTYEDLMVAAINRIRTAILSLPALPAVPGTTPTPTPGTTPAPTAPVPSPGNLPNDAIPFFAPLGGASSTTNNYNVTSNQTFHTQSQAADIAMLAQATARTLRKF